MLIITAKILTYKLSIYSKKELKYKQINHAL